MAVRNDGCGVQPLADAEADVCANGTATCHHVGEGARATRSGICKVSEYKCARPVFRPDFFPQATDDTPAQYVRASFSTSS
jgi:hypothetical protein